MNSLDFSLVLSGVSLVMTAYFWLVQSRRERPNLKFYQLCGYRTVCRRHPNKPDMQRFCMQQVEPGGVLAVNHSTRQNSIVVFDCYLQTASGEIRGDWGYSTSDKPPWNISAESSLAISPAFFFDVPLDFEPPEDPTVRVDFVTASGRKFRCVFKKHAPRWFDVTDDRAASGDSTHAAA